MTPTGLEINEGIQYFGLGVHDKEFVLQYYWYLPIIAYLDYNHKQKLFLKNMMYQACELIFGKAMQSQCWLQQYNTSKISNIVAKSCTWIMDLTPLICCWFTYLWKEDLKTKVIGRGLETDGDKKDYGQGPNNWTLRPMQHTSTFVSCTTYSTWRRWNQ